MVEEKEKRPQKGEIVESAWEERDNLYQRKRKESQHRSVSAREREREALGLHFNALSM